MTQEIWHIDRLKNWDKNPRSITKDDFERLKQQLQKLGQYKPLLVTPDGIVLGGNMRLRAYRELGINDIWVSVVEPKNEDEMLEYALSDNDRAGIYDEQQLAELVSEANIDLSLYKVDLGAPSTLAELLAQLGPGELSEDEAPALPTEPAKSKKGSVYQLGRHRLMCGDSTSNSDINKLLDGKGVNMVFTDPPYNVAYVGKTKDKLTIDNDKMSEEDFAIFIDAVVENIIKWANGAIYLCMSSSEWGTIQSAFRRAGGHWSRTIIWVKNRMVLSRADYHTQFEPIAVLNEDENEEGLPILYGWPEGIKRVWVGGRKQTDIWKIDRPTSNKEHPTMKPVNLCGRAISNSSMPGARVLDLFGGSGSTLIACEQLNRQAYIMEIDPRYCDVIRQRYAKFVDEHGMDKWEELTPEVV